MGWEPAARNWRAMKGKIREQWGKLTDDDLDRIDGRRDRLLGTLQQRYAKTRDVLDREVRDFERRIESDVAAISDAATTADLGAAGSYGVSGGTTGTGVSGSGSGTRTSGGTGSARSLEEARMAGREREGDEQAEQQSGSRGGDGWLGVGGGEQDRRREIERGSSSSQGADEDERG